MNPFKSFLVRSRARIGLHRCILSAGLVVCVLAFLRAGTVLRAQTAPEITFFGKNGQLSWSDSDYTDWLYTVEWSSDLARWTDSWKDLRLVSMTESAKTVQVPMFYRVSKIRRTERVLPPADMVGRSIAIIGYNYNLRVEFTTPTNGVFRGLDSATPPPTEATYEYEVVDTANAFLRVSWPGMTIHGQMHFYSDAGGTLDPMLGRGFFFLE